MIKSVLFFLLLVSSAVVFSGCTHSLRSTQQTVSHNPNSSTDEPDMPFVLQDGWVLVETEHISYAVPSNYQADDQIISSDTTGNGDFFPLSTVEYLEGYDLVDAVTYNFSEEALEHYDFSFQTLSEEPLITEVFLRHKGPITLPSLPKETYLYVVSNDDRHVLFAGWEGLGIEDWEYRDEVLRTVRFVDGE